MTRLSLFFLLGAGWLMSEGMIHTLRAQEKAGGFDRPTGSIWQGRSVVYGKNGMVCTSHPAASQAGLDVLRDGGNAVDAAIAANAMQGFVEPMSCGIGGDLFIIYWDAKTQKLYGLNASGRSPKGLTRDEFVRRGLKQIPTNGPLSWSVPGCVHGWETLRARFGTKPLAKLLEPAMGAAFDGVPVPEVIASYWKGGEKALQKTPEAAATYLIDGRVPRAGEYFRNKRLAVTYQAIASHGAKEFYEGEIAKQIVAASENYGGFFALSDLAEHTSEWVEPVSTNYRGYDVWELPPNGQGIAALEMLNVLELYDLKKFGPGSADYLHVFLEAKKLAFADRARFYADPAFGKLPVKELVSKKYAAKQNKRIDMAKAAVDVPPGDPRLEHSDTIYLCVVDKDRNCCSLIQSNYMGFGSGLVPGELGFAMQNRGALFALEEGHPNVYEPGKRPFHTIIPAMVTKEGKPWLCFGVMGGDMQPQGHVQILVNMIDFNMNVQAAGDAARIQHSGSATPTGLPADGVGTATVEYGITPDVIENLRNRGHHVLRARSNGGGYQGILIDWENGVLQGASESRKDGVALGY